MLLLGLTAISPLGEYTASAKLAERERFELAVRVLIQRLRGAHPPHLKCLCKCHLAWRLGGDSRKAKSRPKGRPFDLMLIYQHLILVAGTGFEPVTFRL